MGKEFKGETLAPKLNYPQSVHDDKNYQKHCQTPANGASHVQKCGPDYWSLKNNLKQLDAWLKCELGSLDPRTSQFASGAQDIVFRLPLHSPPPPTSLTKA